MTDEQFEMLGKMFDKHFNIYLKKLEEAPFGDALSNTTFRLELMKNTHAEFETLGFSYVAWEKELNRRVALNPLRPENFIEKEKL